MSGSSYLLPNDRVLRYDFRERMTHWMAGISYVYLLLTGLAFWTPWLFWIAVVLGGGSTSRMLHPWAGLIFAFAVLRMYAMWGLQMREAPADKAWWNAIRHYISNEDEKVPPVGRFNGGQKLLFWSFFCNPSPRRCAWCPSSCIPWLRSPASDFSCCMCTWARPTSAARLAR